MNTKICTIIFLLTFISSMSFVHGAQVKSSFSASPTSLVDSTISNYSQMDPGFVILMLDDLLEAVKTDEYKRIAIYLMKERGWRYTEIDTITHLFINWKLNEQIKRSNLTGWMIDASQTHYTEWVQTHQKSLYIQNRIAAINYADQEIRQIIKRDTTDPNYNFIYSIVSDFDFNHLLEIRSLCLLNDSMLPNNYDNGPSAYNKIGLILLHNFKNPDNIEKAWDKLYPFIEKTYRAGKIDNTIFVGYDQWLNFHFGYQYYGTLGDKVKVKDEAGLESRMKEFNLKPI